MNRAMVYAGLRTVGVAGLLLVLFMRVIPMIAGAPWADVVDGVTSVPVRDLLLLVTLWAGGLLLHTFTLTAALPRLTHWRALTLSLTGSAVANLLPVGGAAGVTLNYRMVRSWGFARGSFATYTVLTNVWDVLFKLAVPVVALVWLLTGGSTPSRSFVTVTVGATALLAALTCLLTALLVSPSLTRRVGGLVDRMAATAHRLLGSERRPCPSPSRSLVALQADCSTLVRRAWGRLTVGMVGYTLSLAVLLDVCLHLTGAGLDAREVVAGFAVERLLTLASFTPGGAGVVEVGLSGVLLLLGGDPLGVVTGVLIYRAFTFGLEIPVGGVGIAAWWWFRRRSASVVEAAA